MRSSTPAGTPPSRTRSRIQQIGGWGWLLVIAGIFDWSALMLLVTVAIVRFWPRRENNTESP